MGYRWSGEEDVSSPEVCETLIQNSNHLQSWLESRGRIGARATSRRLRRYAVFELADYRNSAHNRDFMAVG
jgi:tRNA(Ile2) C34 agmatinyltransferase TiaS